jgi:hypothetical protein
MISLQTTMPSRDELLLRSSPPKKRLVLGGMSLPTAAAVLRFLYTGEAQLVPENVLDVHLASERLGISALRQLAEHMLPRIVNEENVCSILRDAFALRLTGLMAFASAFALRHFDAILDAAAPSSANASTSFPALHAMLTAASSYGFYSLSRPIVAGLLSSDDLCVASEEKVFRFAVFWGIANVPTNARLYSSSEDYNPANANKGSQGGAGQQQSLQIPPRSSVAAAAAGLGTSISSSSILPVQAPIPMSSQSIATQLFPQIPVALVPALRASLTDIFSSIRFQLLDTEVLRSPLCAALVAPELLLNAMFEKTVGPNNRRDVSDAPPSGVPTSAPSRSYNNDSTPSWQPTSYGAGGGGGGGTQLQYQTTTFSRVSENNPRILSLGSLILQDEDTGAGASAILSARTALSATSGYLSVSSPRRNNSSSGLSAVGATPAYLSSSSSSYYTDRDVYKSVDLEVASALAAEVGGKYDSTTGRYEGGNSSSSSSSSASMPWELQNIKSLLSQQTSSNTRSSSLPHRRFSELDPTIAKDISLLRFDAFMQGKVTLGNLGRSAAFAAQSSPAVVSSLPASALQMALAASASSAEGARGASLLTIIPCVSVRSNSSSVPPPPLPPPSTSAAQVNSNINLDPALPAGPIYSFEFVVEDSEALHDVDPENEQAKTKAATIGSTTIAPFELALCLMPNGAALSSLVAGQKSPNPADHGAVWCLTNRGDLYVSKQSSIAATNAPPIAAPLPPNAEGAEGAPLPSQPVEDKKETLTPPSLTCIATDIRFGVSSSICLSIDSSSGDIGVSVLNVRVGFDSEGNFDGAGWDEGDDEEDDDYAEERNRGGDLAFSQGARGVLERSTASAPRSPPLPFNLLPRAESIASPSLLHSSDPSMGKLAFIHAAACKLPVDSLKLNAGLQLCLLARSTNRLAVTLVPSKGFCRS